MSKKKPPRAAKATRAKQTTSVELGVRMTIVQAAGLHRTLLASVARGETVVVDGTRVEANVTDLRLLDIAFDAKTLRVIAEAVGSVNVAVDALP